MVSGVWFTFNYEILVDPPGDQTLATFMTNINYESIQFHKRAKNNTDHISLSFKITDLKSRDAELRLFYNGQDTTMGNAGDNVDVYFEEKLSASGDLVAVIVHLKNHGDFVFAGSNRFL